MIRALALVVGMLCAACAQQSLPLEPSSSGPYDLSGTISSMTGGPIAGARLTVQSGVNMDKQTITDATGHYAFDNLESGRFTVVIDAPGFVSVSPVVDLFRDIEANFGLFKHQ